MPFLLDSNVCVAILRGKPAGVAERLRALRPDDVKLSAVTAAELAYGAWKSARKEENLAKIATFLAPYEIVPFDGFVAAAYGELAAAVDRNGTPVGAMDLQIAATALRFDFVLVSHDAIFRSIPSLRTIDWEIG